MNTRSIQKLKRKFILVAMVSYALVMLFIGSLIYSANLIITRADIRNVLNYIIENEGSLPGAVSSTDTGTEEEAAAEEEAEAQEDAEEEEGLTENVEYSLQELFGLSLGITKSTEFRYSTRYFVVIYGADGEAEDVITSHIASVDEEQAISLAEIALKRRSSFGNYGNYYYKWAELEDGRKIVVYLDCMQQVLSNLRIFYSAMIICFFGLLITFILVCIFSNSIVRPEIENARRQKQFITNASHELKTPLAVIRANTEIEEMMGGETEWTRSTMRQVERLNTLIQNLVLISRSAEQGADNAVLVDVDVSAVAESTADTFKNMAVQDGKTFERNIAENVHMKAEESHLRQLLGLLLDNAIKYCDEAGTITVAVSKKGRNVTLAVSNSYADGASTDYSRFFDRFYREDQSHNVDRGGYGIGLSIAESLVQKYRGSINAAWKAGVITFTCVLPDGLR